MNLIISIVNSEHNRERSTFWEGIEAARGKQRDRVYNAEHSVSSLQTF